MSAKKDFATRRSASSRSFFAFGLALASLPALISHQTRRLSRSGKPHTPNSLAISIARSHIASVTHNGPVRLPPRLLIPKALQRAISTATERLSLAE